MHPPAQRLLSLDAFRGFIMLLMASSGFGIVQMASAHPDSLWKDILPQFEHRAWQGCSLWDLIQPSFMFMVGIAVPFSCAARRERGHSFLSMLGHAILRAVLLIGIAIIISTPEKESHTIFTFTNVLAQIGLGYVFLFLIVQLGRESIIASIIVLLGGYTAFFILHPLPTAEQLAAIEGLKGAREGMLEGFWSHWGIHTNAAAHFDSWFLNLFPPHNHTFQAGGYQTLNFIPSLATMLGGALTGLFLQRSPLEPRWKCARLIIVGIVLIFIGFILGFGAIPIVKRIWTPSWAIFSGGWVLLMLAVFYALVEIADQRRLVFPLVVVGMNSITMYLMHHELGADIARNLHTHLPGIFVAGWEPIIEKCSVLFVLWLVCFWLYRQRAFLRL
ncbi:MAG: DUF5009 domain-containing protein [Verrucomicrobiaceae bacterium]|nr:DUF5009 domain-containing protein [Verrucomicrobiaceae bacterium]